MQVCWKPRIESAWCETPNAMSNVIPGKQKYEMLTIQFPCCESSATLDNRILMPSCKKNLEVYPASWNQMCISQLPIASSQAEWSLRIAIVNATYSKSEARTKVLEVVTWSFNALSVLAPSNLFISQSEIYLELIAVSQVFLFISYHKHLVTHLRSRKISNLRPMGCSFYRA